MFRAKIIFYLPTYSDPWVQAAVEHIENDKKNVNNNNSNFNF